MIKETIRWIMWQVVLPLMLFFVGALVRLTFEGAVSWEIFDPAELSFSMAMLSLLVAISANKLRDESLGGILCAVYVSATIIFVLFFVSASFLRLLIESEVLASLDNMRSFLQGGKTVSPDVLPDLASIHMALYELIFSRVRLGAIALSLITVPVTVLFRHRYNLGE